MRTRVTLLLVGTLLLALVFLRAGITRGFINSIRCDQPARPVQLRVWDWWSPAGNEDYGRYFDAVERIFEERNPDVDVVYQIVPFGNYVQKLSTAMVGDTPPDVFQSSVFWAEGFYHRGMLRPLNDLLAENERASPPERVTEEMFLPPAWRHNRAQDGSVFGVPQDIDARCLIWNLDILEREAARDRAIRDLFVRREDNTIDYARLRFEAITSWDHFRSVTQKLTRRSADGSLEQAGFVIHSSGGGAGMFSHWLASNGGRYQDAAGTRATFADEAGVEVLRFLARLYWEDRVCPPFRRQISDTELFQERKVACVVGGTWSGMDIIRDTLGWKHFSMTAFPPGPRGDGQRTVTWGNMLVISRRSKQVDAAWRYVQFVCGLEGNLLRSRILGSNGPRLDFYQTEQWHRAIAERPYMANVKNIYLVGEKLRHTEIIAVDHQVNPIIETLLLRFPGIEAGRGPYPSIEAALQEAERNANGVFRRYNAQVARWLEKRGEG